MRNVHGRRLRAFAPARRKGSLASLSTCAHYLTPPDDVMTMNSTNAYWLLAGSDIIASLLSGLKEVVKKPARVHSSATGVGSMGHIPDNQKCCDVEVSRAVRLYTHGKEGHKWRRAYIASDAHSFFIGEKVVGE